VRVRGLCKAYGDTRALDGVDLTITHGEVVGLLGPNGAGKTTLVEILEGHRARDAGEVSVLGFDPADGDQDFRDRIGIVLQDGGHTPVATVAEAVRVYSAAYPHPRPLSEVLELVGLTGKANERIKSLSGGQRRRLDLALGIAGDPDLIFLDEPTTGFDPSARRRSWELVENLRSLGKTILLTTHYMDEAERLCDRVAIMDHGKVIAQGTPRELIASIGVEHVVEFSAGGAAPDLEGVRAMAGVRGVRSENGSVLLQVTELHRSVPALLDELGRQGVALTELRTHSASLEDVFVHLTGRHLRDE